MTESIFLSFRDGKRVSSILHFVCFLNFYLFYFQFYVVA